MSGKKGDRVVGPHPDGGWQSKAHGAKRAGYRTGTQAEAMRRSRKTIRNTCGGEMVVQGRDGRIRQKNTIPRGNDPRDIPG